MHGAPPENSSAEPSDSLPPAHPASPPACRFNPWLFFGFLLLPAVASPLAFWATSGHNYGESAIVVLIGTALLAGLVCGVHFTNVQRGLSPVVRVVVGLVSVVGCAGVSVAIAFGGCMAIAQAGRL